MCGDREGRGGKGREVKVSERLAEGAVEEELMHECCMWVCEKGSHNNTSTTA